jgi:hypothetical protein
MSLESEQREYFTDVTACLSRAVRDATEDRVDYQDVFVRYAHWLASKKDLLAQVNRAHYLGMPAYGTGQRLAAEFLSTIEVLPA